jgi:hypothetical protein
VACAVGSQPNLRGSASDFRGANQTRQLGIERSRLTD